MSVTRFLSIANPPAGGDQFRRLFRPGMGGQQQDASVRGLVADHLGRLETCRHPVRWHPDIDGGQIWLVLTHPGQQPRGIPGLAHDLES
jgi:hypothetical protein